MTGTAWVMFACFLVAAGCAGYALHGWHRVLAKWRACQEWNGRLAAELLRTTHQRGEWS